MATFSLPPCYHVLMSEQEKLKLYKAVLSRDPRNDGRFFVAVKTTGIYCRPICPAKPKFENVEFFKSKAEAENAGYRPCLRCKPDLSPLSPQWRGTAAVMGRALNLLESSSLESMDIETIAEKLGMTDRHLRRLFHEHIGASPIDVVISRRLHLARQLLTQTSLPVTEIAFASGFKSLRRFNDAFQKTYKNSPRSFRKDVSNKKTSSELLRLELPYTPPFDWDWLMNFFERHETVGVEHVHEGEYIRHFQTVHGYNFYKLSHLKSEHRIQVEVHVQNSKGLKLVIDQIRSQLDLAHNPHHIEFKKLGHELKTVRIPGAFDPFEVAISIILGQVVSTEQAKKNIQKLVEKFGEKVKDSFHINLTHFFPTAKVLASADLSTLGFTRARCEAITCLSLAVASGEIDLSRNADPESTRKKLLSIKGIGSWTTELILMRCLSDTDAFPANDLILKRALKIEHIDLETLAPWRSYVALAIWKKQAHILTKKKRKV